MHEAKVVGMPDGPWRIKLEWDTVSGCTSRRYKITPIFLRRNWQMWWAGAHWITRLHCSSVLFGFIFVLLLLQGVYLLSALLVKSKGNQELSLEFSAMLLQWPRSIWKCRLVMRRVSSRSKTSKPIMENIRISCTEIAWKSNSKLRIMLILCFDIRRNNELRICPSKRSIHQSN
jgi:hypothetical protein